MVDTANKKETVLEIIDVIEEHKGGDTVGLFIGAHCSWTDYFVIATASSSAHLKSLNKQANSSNQLSLIKLMTCSLVRLQNQRH